MCNVVVRLIFMDYQEVVIVIAMKIMTLQDGKAEGKRTSELKQSMRVNKHKTILCSVWMILRWLSFQMPSDSWWCCKDCSCRWSYCMSCTCYITCLLYYFQVDSGTQCMHRSFQQQRKWLYDLLHSSLGFCCWITV